MVIKSIIRKVGNMFKKSAFILFLILAICRSFAADIAVPILYQAKDIPVDKHRIVGLGMYQDDEKFVWAIRISQLQKAIKKDNFGIGLYFNSDNDKNTGRFAGTSGWDYQINLKSTRISIIRWRPGNKPEHLPLYVDDYLVETAGDILYVALRKAAAKNIIFAQKMVFRCIASVKNSSIGELSRTVTLNKNSGTFAPVLKFTRFGNENSKFKKKSEAVIIPRKDGVKVWNSFGERYAEDEEMPKIIGNAEALKAFGARGESESFFFAVTTDKPAQNLEVAATDLVDSKGNRIPASDTFVRYIGFAGTLREEYYTDILSPVFMKSKSRNNFVMLRVNTPRNIPAGVYKGLAKIKLDGKDIDTVPLEFEVYDFEMPEQPFFQTAYCIKPAHIKKFFTKMSGAEMKAEFQALNKLAREYRFSPRLISAKRPIKWKQNEPVIDWRNFDKAAKQYFFEYKYTCFQDSFFQMGSHDKMYPQIKSMLKFDTPDFETRFGMMVKKTYDHYRELGILDKTLFIFWDEPYRSVYPYIRRGIASAKKYAPEVQAGVFIDHVALELEDCVDIWLSKFSTAAKLRMGKNKSSKKVWTYNNVGVSNFNTPASMPRMYYFLAYKYDINGYLYSEINIYNDNSGMKRQDIHYNKWVNHCWFYPGKIPGKPMASLRMELSRDGLDDYDYLTIYKKLSGNRELPEAVQKIMPDLKLSGGITFKIGSNRELQQIREILAREIVKLKTQR